MSDVRATPPAAPPWALAVPARHADTVLALRLVPGIEVAESAGELWLRGRTAEADAVLALLKIPARARYHWLDGDTLRPVGSRLVTARLPDARWQAVREWSQVTLPPPAAPALFAAPATVSLELAPAETWREANAWITALPAWERWVAAAPAVRLHGLRFAAADTGRVLVLGTPPPSLPGGAMVESDGIVLPAACRWLPAVAPATVRRALGAGADTLVLWERAGVQLLDRELFVPASRAGVRLTVEGAG